MLLVRLTFEPQDVFWSIDEAAGRWTTIGQRLLNDSVDNTRFYRTKKHVLLLLLASTTYGEQTPALLYHKMAKISVEVARQGCYKTTECSV